MRAVFKILAGGGAVAALVSAAPAAAQYYPNPYGYGQGGGAGVIGQVINQVLGGGYGGYGAYGGGYGNQQAAISQCVGAVQARLNGGQNGYSPYGGYNPYGGAYGGGYGGYGYQQGYNAGGRVLGISRIEPRSNGGVTIRGVATSGTAANYGYGYAGQGQVDLTFKCKADYRGFISDVDIDRARSVYGNNSYTPYNRAYDYSQYGYRRF